MHEVSLVFARTATPTPHWACWACAPDANALPAAIPPCRYLSNLMKELSTAIR